MLIKKTAGVVDTTTDASEPKVKPSGTEDDKKGTALSPEETREHFNRLRNITKLEDSGVLQPAQREFFKQQRHPPKPPRIDF